MLGMGLHVASARVRRAVRGHRRHSGEAEDILRAGLEDCWSGEYLTASPGHYRQFWMRDLGFAAPSLVALGGTGPARVLSSLKWAVGVWRARGSHVTTTINPLLRRPVDIFDYGIDSLPMFLASLQAVAEGADAQAAAGAHQLASENRAWIAGEVEYFVERAIDARTGLVRADRTFSAHRDTFHNGSTAYANVMAAVLARTVTKTGCGPDLVSHHYPDGSDESRSRDWGALLRRHFWAGDRFRDRLGSNETSGEANVWPFFAGLIDDRSMLEAALQTLRDEGYTRPFPLRFEAQHSTDRVLTAFKLWSPDYQTTATWTSLGSMYVTLLQRLDPGLAEGELDRWRALIERDGTFWEVLDERGRPWTSRMRLSVSDHSMLWGAILLRAMIGR